MVNPNTLKQGSRKTGFGNAIGQWKGLTDEQRANWNTYATTFPVPTRLNSASYLNGFNAFGRRVAAMTPLGAGGVPTTPDSTQGVIGDYQVELLRSGSALLLSWDWSPTEGPWYSLFYLTRALSPTQKFNKSWARYIDGLLVSATTELDITDKYRATFGITAGTGQLIGFQVVFINQVNGQVVYTQPVILTVTT